jgi:prepilin-type N-terminal cleavage/methylation domain-containing protein
MRRGFTLVELAICLSVSAVLVPLAWMFARSLDAHVVSGQWQLEVSQAVRTVSEQLGRDQQGGCHAHYALRGTDLVRTADAACGGEQVLATRVSRFERQPGGVQLDFERALSPERAREVRFFIPLEAP